MGVSEQENGAMLLVGTWWRIKQEKLIEKLLLIMWRLRVPICSRVLQLSKLCRCLERQLLTAIYCQEELGRLRCPVTSLDAEMRDLEKRDKDAVAFLV